VTDPATPAVVSAQAAIDRAVATITEHTEPGAARGALLDAFVLLVHALLGVANEALVAVRPMVVGHGDDDAAGADAPGAVRT
jgi:hypothetical protein